MKRSEQDRLLGEIFADEGVERLRAASLAGGLAALRARRRRRTYVSGAAVSFAIAIAALVSTRRQPHVETTVRQTEPKTNAVQIINDEQLLALFPDRSVALIGRPGQQRLVFFADGESRQK
jgi:hypothetical protein